MTSPLLNLSKRVAVLALPMGLQTLLQAMLGMADVVMVSGLGAAAIAAVGLSAKLHFLLLVVMLGVATACSILVAQYTGAKNEAASKHTLALTLIIGSLLMLPFMLLFSANNSWWLSILNPDPEVVALASKYLFITAAALILTQWIVIFESALRSIGNTTLPLVIGGFAAISNIFFNYVLIFGHFGFPELGVAGAAWGTLLSRCLQVIAIIAYLAMKQHPFSALHLDFVHAFNFQRAKRFLLFAFPLISNYFIWALGNATYHILTGYAGTNALAVMGIMVPIESAFFALFIGTANASAIMIGQNLGADKTEEAWQLYRFFDRLTISAVIVFSASLWLASPLIVNHFAESNAEAATLLQKTLLIFCLLTWIKVINMQRIIGVLRAGADNNFVLVVDTIVMWAIGLPAFALGLFYFNFPFYILYILMYLEDTAKFPPMWWRLGKRYWLKNLTRVSHSS